VYVQPSTHAHTHASRAHVCVRARAYNACALAFVRSRSVEEGYSLSIEAGNDGARLTHSHVRQYHYVLQSLVWWWRAVCEHERVYLLCV
jgi:hypothetical protein